MLRAYKTKVVTNNQESGYFLGCAGFGRFVYNWGLAAWKEEQEGSSQMFGVRLPAGTLVPPPYHVNTKMVSPTRAGVD